MDGKDPFGYPMLTYLWVFALAGFAGMIRHLNNMRSFSLGRFLIDVISAAFTGLITFWLCKWGNISGPLSAVLIATSGLMGNRAWQELEHLWRIRLLGIDQYGNPMQPREYTPPPERDRREQ